jgi:hypothetical protein
MYTIVRVFYGLKTRIDQSQKQSRFVTNLLHAVTQGQSFCVDPIMASQPADIGILDLPDDVLDCILSVLSVRDRLCLTSVCQKLGSVRVNSDPFWQKVCEDVRKPYNRISSLFHNLPQLSLYPAVNIARTPDLYPGISTSDVR